MYIKLRSPLYINTWQRIAIIVSMIWVVGAAIYTREELRRKQDAAYQAEFGSVYQRCLDMQHPVGVADLALCHNQAAEAGGIATRSYRRSKKLLLIALVSLGPIAFGWLVAYVLLRIMPRAKPGF